MSRDLSASDPIFDQESYKVLAGSSEIKYFALHTGVSQIQSLRDKMGCVQTPYLF